MTRGIFLLCLLWSTFLSANNREWFWQSPFPQGNKIIDIHGTAANDIFAVGENGTIIHFDGRRWRSLVSHTTKRIDAVWANSPNDVFAVGFGGIILHYDGDQWSEMLSPTASDLRGVWGSRSDDVFVVGSPSIVLHYDGTEWTLMDVPSNPGGYFGIWGDASDNVFIAGFGGKIIHYDGQQWLEMPSPVSDQIRSLHGVENGSSNDIFGITGFSSLLHFDGTKWNQITPTVVNDYNILDIWVHEKDDIFGVGENGALYHYDGKKWLKMRSPTNVYLLGIWGSDRDNILAGGERGTILHFDSLNWINLDFRMPSSPRGIWGFSHNDIFTVTGEGKIFHYDGEQWSKMVSPAFNNNLMDIWGKSNNDIYAVGVGAIFHFNGAKWVRMSIPTRLTLNSVWGDESPNSKDVFAVGENGMILHYNGSKWNIMSSPIDKELQAVWGTSKNNIYAGGEFSGILHYDGNEWEFVDLSIPGTIYDIWGTSASDIFAVGENSKIRHFDGNTWTEMVTPTEQDQLEGVWGNSGTDVFAVGREAFGTHPKSVIFNYDGTEWKKMNFTSDIWLHSIWGSNEGDILAIGSSNVILELNEPGLLPPNRLRAFEVTPQEVNLDWEDNAIGEEGYILERKSEGRDDFQQIGVLPPNTTIFEDKNIQPLTTYFYRLKSFDSRGESRYSNVKSIITAVGEMMCVNTFNGTISADGTNAIINMDIFLNNFPDSFVPSEDILNLVLADNQGTSYKILLTPNDFIKLGKVPGVFTVRNTTKGISGSLKANIDSSSKSILKISARKVPISFFTRRSSSYPLNVSLQWGNFSQNVDLIAQKTGTRFSYNRTKNQQTTKDLYLDTIKARTVLNRPNIDTLEIKAFFPGAEQNLDIANAPLKISIGKFYFEIPAAKLKRNKYTANGEFPVGIGSVSISISLTKNTILFRGRGLNLRDALEQNVVVSLQVGDFSQDRSVTLSKKETATFIDFSYK